MVTVYTCPWEKSSYGSNVHKGHLRQEPGKSGLCRCRDRMNMQAQRRKVHRDLRICGIIECSLLTDAVLTAGIFIRSRFPVDKEVK